MLLNSYRDSKVREDELTNQQCLLKSFEVKTDKVSSLSEALFAKSFYAANINKVY